MLSRPIASTAFASLVLWTACSSSPAVQPPPAPSGAPAATAATEAPSAPAPVAGPDAPKPAAPKAESVADCKAMLASLPDGPLPEATAADGGTSDRYAPMKEFMKLKREGFRCCFDIWARKIPEAKLYGKVTFSLELKPDGTLKEATVKPEEGALPVSPDVEKCLVEVAGTVKYPKSASGMVTTYTHRFDFKPRRQQP